MNMKKIIPAAALILACAAFAGCGGSDSSGGSSPASAVSAASAVSLPDRTAALKDAVKFPELVSVRSDTLKDRYGIEPDDVADLSAYICGSGAMPDEFGVFTAKDADAAGRIAERLNKRVEQQRGTFKDYTPAEMYKFDDCFVETRGTTVAYAVCADNSKAKELLFG